MGIVYARLASDGRLGPGIELEEAADIAWAIASPHHYEYLVLELGWSLERTAPIWSRQLQLGC